MPSGGYLYWTADAFRGKPYLDGVELGAEGWEEQGGFSWAKSPGLFVLPTWAGTNILQRPWYGTNRSNYLSRYTFQAGFLADIEEDYFRILRAQQKGVAVAFVPYLWTEEVVEGTTGQSYTLPRKAAWSIAPGVTSGTHPAVYHKNDVVDANCATLSGQTLAVAETGQIAVRYMPAFYVVVETVSEQLQTVNGFRFGVTLTEVISLT